LQVAARFTGSCSVKSRSSANCRSEFIRENRAFDRE
jgi:hypothetical protein